MTGLLKRIARLMCIIGIVLMIGWIVVMPVMGAPGGQGEAPKGGPDDMKIDVGIYEGINEEENPIDADPDDGMMFHFDVDWTVTRTVVSTGEIKYEEVHEVGQYHSAQGNTANFDMIYGKPYKFTYCDGIKILGVCFGTVMEEQGFYHIGHYNIPDGYCPQYPYGQSRTKDGTQTENMKFFKGDACYKLYPYFDGRFGYCIGFPYFHRCYIRIQ